MPSIEVDIDWMDSPTDGAATAPTIAMPEPAHRDTIPVLPEWLEVDDGPAPAAPAIPRAPAKPALESPPRARPAVHSRSSRPPKAPGAAKKSSAPPKRRG
jgi:hypothetical protein